MADTPPSAFLQVPTWTEMANVFMRIGFPSVLALGLLYFVLDRQEARMKGMETQLVSMTTQLRSMTDLVAQLEMTSQLTVWVLTQTCINEATDRESRERCISRPSHGDGR